MNQNNRIEDHPVLVRYRSHKTVHAAKLKNIQFRKDGGAVMDTDNGILNTKAGFRERFKGSEEDMGYYVRYKDGYESWSPTKAFEEGYSRMHEADSSTENEKVSGLTFGRALEALKRGKRVAREGWNGKNMFLFLLPAGTVPTKAIHDPALRQVIESEVGGDTFDALGSIRMFTADKKILTGWLASQTDMLEEDWVIL